MCRLSKKLIAMATVMTVVASSTMMVGATEIQPRIPNEPWKISAYPGGIGSDDPIGVFSKKTRTITCSSYYSDPFAVDISVSGGANLQEVGAIDYTS